MVQPVLHAGLGGAADKERLKFLSTYAYNAYLPHHRAGVVENRCEMWAHSLTPTGAGR